MKIKGYWIIKHDEEWRRKKEGGTRNEEWRSRNEERETDDGERRTENAEGYLNIDEWKMENRDWILKI